MKVQVISDDGKIVFESTYPSRYSYNEKDDSLVRAVLAEALWISHRPLFNCEVQTCQVTQAPQP